MQIIKKASEQVVKAWGIQKSKELRYRLLRYLISQETEQGLLLHNVVTGELVLLNQDEKEIVSALPCEYRPEMEDLIGKHFLVPEDFNEYKSVHQIRKFLRMMNRSKGIEGYTILPTTNCNARCFYCYEADCRKLNMSEETASESVKFMKDHLHDKKLSILWFGGEPLIGMNRIDQICRELSQDEIDYTTTMISNGYLFNQDVVKKAKDLWKLISVQITLDGTEEVYNSVKNYVSSHGSPFQRVMNNIEYLLQAEIAVSVRMNLDYHNADDLNCLIDQLKERFLQYKTFHAYVHVLFDDEGYEPVRHTAQDKQLLNQKQFELSKKLIDWVNPGRRAQLPSLVANSCMADNDTSAIIYPDGTMAKCEHYMDEVLGNVRTGFTEKDAYGSWKETFEVPECRECVLLPKCIKLKRCPSCADCFEQTRELELISYTKTMKELLQKFFDKSEPFDRDVSEESDDQ